MPTILAPQRPSAIAEPLQHLKPRPRATVLDRYAMRVGMWLLIWSTRPVPDRERERLTHEAARERELRERRYLTHASLTRRGQ